MGRTRPLFFVFSAQLTINKCSIKVCRWLDSNRRSLVSEVTALPTEPHHCPTLIICKTIHLFQIIYKSYTKKTKKLHQCVLLKNVLNICKTIHLFQIIQWRPLQRSYQKAALWIDAMFGIALIILAATLIYNGWRRSACAANNPPARKLRGPR